MRIEMSIFLKLLFSLVILNINVNAFSDEGKRDFIMNADKRDITIPKALFADSQIFVQITCDAEEPDTEIQISWELTETQCWQDYVNYYEFTVGLINGSQVQSERQIEKCNHGGHIILNELKLLPSEHKNSIEPHEQVFKRSNNDLVNVNSKAIPAPHPVFVITKDGMYLFSLHIQGQHMTTKFEASVHIEMKASYGYLSADDWPLLPFYGAMCIVYVIFGIIWLTVSFLQWRDLLRIQFWIGGVILLGMLEKAVFYAEYQTTNSSGVPIRGVVVLAEWVSCAKRTLARMLVIIVSLGFGIVKPRLGPMLHRVVGTGTLYFVLACVEGYLRVMHTKNDPMNQIFVASIPLAVLDSAICWWIFTSLVQTTRTLRLRRNMVKLALYRHFTNTLIFAVIASVVFMLYSIKTHHLGDCLKNWKELWVDAAFWHILFSVLLLVIMILWRPTNNNQRYAFTPLLDNPEDDDDDDDEEDQFVSDAYGVKMRGPRSNSPRPTKGAGTTTEEDDLRWVEENIPAAIVDAALPVLDSDEEIINTKFEVSKMQ